MILSNVNIGTGPSSGDGDPLRNAFTTINNNFQTIKNNVNALTNSVSTVAGRTGNVVLTVNDVIGAASVAYVNSQLGNAGSYSNVNVTAFLPSYSGNIAAVITANLAMKGYVDASIASLVDSAPGTLDTLNELAAALGDDPNLSVTLTNTINSANTKMKAYVDGQITAANTLAYSNVNTLSYLTTNSYATQNYVNLANTSLKNYVDGQIAAANTSSNYGNAQVATYLASYGGNVAVGNIIFDDLSVQTTAYTGTQWRSNLQSNVRVKPSWLSYVPGGKNQEGTQYGFDAGGMFFTSNADNDFAYPIQTNLHFHEEDVLEVVATICYGATNNDHGLCIFPADTRPIWRAGTDASRIAFQFNAGIPLLYGRTTANTAPGNSILTDGNYYTIKFVYDKDNTVTVSTFSGNTATGTALDIRSVNEVMPAGDYKLGFDADNDSAGVKSYWTNLVVRTLTNTVVNNLEVQGVITSNLIPSSNITYSLGNVTHQWRDLFVSNSTIYMSGVPLSIDIGGNLLINGNTVAGSSYANAAVKTYLENYDGSIVQIPDEHLYIRVQDADNDDFSVYQQVDDGASTVLGQTRLRRDQFVIEFPGPGFQFRFNDIGQVELPGNIRFNEYVDSSIYAVSDNSYNGSAELKVISYSGDTLGSNVRVTQNYASISTNNAQYSWLFTNTNRLIVPQHSVITTANATGGLGGNTISIIGGASDADTWNSNPGGNVDIQGGYGSFADGSGGNGGDVNIRGGGSAEAQKGRVVISSGTNNWVFANTGTVTVPGEGVIQSLDDSVTLQSLNTTSGYANSIYLSSGGGIGFFDQSIGGNWLEIFRSGVTPEIKAPTGNLLITSVVPGVSSNTWTFGQNGSITFPDNTVQTTAYTGGGGSYSNVQVATYLPTYSGNVANITLGPSGVLTFADGTTMITASVGGGSNYGNGNVASYLITNGYVNTNSAYSNSNVTAYTVTMGFTNYSNVNTASYLGVTQIAVANIKLNPSGNIVFADGTTQITAAVNNNYGNVNVKAYTENIGLTNYSNVNAKAYTESMSFTNYSNVNVQAYLSGSVTGIVPASAYSNNLGTNVKPWGNFFTYNMELLGGYLKTGGTGGLNGQVLKSTGSVNPPAWSNIADIIAATTGQITIANIKLAPSGNIVFPDNSVQTTAYINSVNTAAISANVLTLDFSLTTQIVTHDANISNVAISNGPGNLTSKSMTVILTQDATGGRTISGYYKTQDGLGLDIDTTALAVNIYTFLAVNNGSTTDLYAFSNGTNFI